MLKFGNFSKKWIDFYFYNEKGVLLNGVFGGRPTTLAQDPGTGPGLYNFETLVRPGFGFAQSRDKKLLNILDVKKPPKFVIIIPSKSG